MAKHIPLEIVKRSIENSFCFDIYKNETDGTIAQIGFARVITNKAIFACLADVFIATEYRSKGLSKWLIKEIMVTLSCSV